MSEVWFTVEYEGPTVIDGDVEILLAPGARLRRVDMSELRRVCSRCGGSGSIEASHQEDARFSFQDQCPECSSWGVVPLLDIAGSSQPSQVGEKP